MKVLCVCREGRNRSRHLAEYLRGKGCDAQYGGVDMPAVNPLTQEKVDWADIIIVLRPQIKELLLAGFDTEGKRIMTLDVAGTSTPYGPQAVALEQSSKQEFLEKYIFPEIEKQIGRHLPLRI